MLIKPHTYKNRYGDEFTFTPTEDGNILWEGNFEYCRYGWENNPSIITMVDPSGGPYLAKDMKSSTIHSEIVGRFVKEFIRTDNGYKIILEDKK